MRTLLVLLSVPLLSNCAIENCRAVNCEKVEYPISTLDLTGRGYSDTVAVDSFAVDIFPGWDEIENAGGLSKKSVVGSSDCGNCIDRTTLTHLAFSVDVVPPGRDTVKAESNYLLNSQKGANYYRFIFGRGHWFSGNDVRVSYKLLVNDSVLKTGYKDFVIKP